MSILRLLLKLLILRKLRYYQFADDAVIFVQSITNNTGTTFYYISALNRIYKIIKIFPKNTLLAYSLVVYYTVKVLLYIKLGSRLGNRYYVLLQLWYQVFIVCHQTCVAIFRSYYNTYYLNGYPYRQLLYLILYFHKGGTNDRRFITNATRCCN